MRRWLILTGMAMAPALAFGACGEGSALRDWGLHRQWAIACDLAHPERPATLIEVPWTTLVAPATSEPDTFRAKTPAPDVRSGMRVTLWRHEDSVDVHLAGVALSTAACGEQVKVRAGLGPKTFVGIVRGPAVVELTQPQDIR